MSLCIICPLMITFSCSDLEQLRAAALSAMKPLPEEDDLDPVRPPPGVGVPHSGPIPTNTTQHPGRVYGEGYVAETTRACLYAATQFVSL